MNRRDRFVVRPEIDEPDDREVRKQRKQSCEQRDAYRGWHGGACTASGGEHVARAPNRVEQWLLEPLVELAAQPADVNVDDVGAGIEVVVPNLLEQHRASDNASFVPGEIFEQQI